MQRREKRVQVRLASPEDQYKSRQQVHVRSCAGLAEEQLTSCTHEYKCEYGHKYGLVDEHRVDELERIVEQLEHARRPEVRAVHAVERAQVGGLAPKYNV